jgi:ATP-dependent DNA ligase
VFDLLVDERGKSWVAVPLLERRKRLESFAKRYLAKHPRIALSPATTDRSVALRWFRSTRGALDGVIAKRADLEYRSGDRTGMQKIKQRRTADCVVGGFRHASTGRAVGSLLLGLYDDDGLLHPIGGDSGESSAVQTP